MTSHKKAYTIGALLGLAALTISLCAGLALAADPPAVGTMAPDFKLNSQEGQSLGPRDFRGKWVVLYFYPKDFTQGCTIEAHGFQRDMAQYEARKAVVMGVSVDSEDSHKDFCAKEGLTFKLLADTKKEVVAKYGSSQTRGENVMALRNTFILDPSGKIAKVFIGVNPNKHSEEVLAALAELQK